MPSPWKRALGLAVPCLVVGLMPTASLATNGMNMIGYGAVSSSMGGASLAGVDNPSAMNINPAGLCECSSPELDGGLSLLMPFLQHEDNLGNDEKAEQKYFPLPLLTFSSPIKGLPLTWGIGLFAQGGMGAEYKDLNTPFGGTDDTYTNVMFAKLTPTLAWQVAPSFRLGASLNLGYAQTALKFFPDTSAFMNLDADPSTLEVQFPGMEMKDMWALSYGGRFGFQYRFGELSVGGAYLTATDLEFDHGTMTLNFTNMPTGPSTTLGTKVKYDAKMTGFDWPQQAGLGVNYRVAPWVRVAADVNWIDWSSAVKTVKIKVKNPDTAGAPEKMTIPFAMDWKDQWVYALGIEFLPAPAWAVRFGYNHANSPVPDDTLTPLFPAIVTDHLTAGFGYKAGDWTYNTGVEYALPAKQTNDNTNPNENPFGPGSVEKHSQLTLHAQVGRVF
ncbi:MAG: outer membrane protein transport protein [Deltaproteobacteria bacterium]|nr:outer membrane protein transport protein [Deltaproteobacteria bacterium]